MHGPLALADTVGLVVVKKKFSGEELCFENGKTMPESVETQQTVSPGNSSLDEEAARPSGHR